MSLATLLTVKKCKWHVACLLSLKSMHHLLNCFSKLWLNRLQVPAYWVWETRDKAALKSKIQSNGVSPVPGANHRPGAHTFRKAESSHFKEGWGRHIPTPEKNRVRFPLVLLPESLFLWFLSWQGLMGSPYTSCYCGWWPWRDWKGGRLRENQRKTLHRRPEQ